MTSHDQNFKNLILDYPLQALQLFAPQEAAALDASVSFDVVYPKSCGSFCFLSRSTGRAILHQ